jgi:hypothetical protein
LATATQKEWAVIPSETFRHLVENLTCRVQALIEAPGGITILSRCPDTVDTFVAVNTTHFTHCIDFLMAHVSTLSGLLQVFVIMFTILLNYNTCPYFT